MSMSLDNFTEADNEALADSEAKQIRYLEELERRRQDAGAQVDEGERRQRPPAPPKPRPKTVEELLALEGFEACRKAFRFMKEVQLNEEPVRLICDLIDGRPSFYAKASYGWVRGPQVEGLAEVRRIMRAVFAIGSRKLTEFSEEDA